MRESANSLERCFGREGLGEPVVATSVAQAIELARKTEPALAILDVGLPDGSGIDIATTLRTRSDVPILFLSARTRTPTSWRDLALERTTTSPSLST